MHTPSCKRFLTVLLGILLVLVAPAQPTDSAFRALSLKVDNLQQQTVTLVAKLDTLSKSRRDPTSSSPSNPSQPCSELSLGSLKGFLVVTPLLLFIVSFAIILNRLKKDGFKISEALSTVRPTTTVTVNKTYGIAGAADTVQQQSHTEDEMIRSSSRTLAFLTGITALIIAIIVTSYIGYQALSGCGTTISLDGLWKILLALGIGVIPYGANVLGGNKKEQPSGTTTL